MTFEALERGIWEDQIRIGVDKAKAPRAVLSARPPLGSHLSLGFRGACRIVLAVSLVALAWGLFEIYRAQYAYGFLGLVFWGLLSTLLERLAIRHLRGLAAADEAALLAGIATGLFRLARRRPDGGFEPLRYP